MRSLNLEVKHQKMKLNFVKSGEKKTQKPLSLHRLMFVQTHNERRLDFTGKRFFCVLRFVTV